MWLESFWNYEQFWNAEKRENLNYDLSFLINSQNNIESEARDYVLNEQASWRDTTELTKYLNELIERQRKENESLEKQLRTETKEDLDKEALINEARMTLYDKLWINNNLESNSVIQKFLKWFVDELLIWNYELAIEVYNSWWKVILENLSKLASYEWLKQIAESLWDNVINLLSWNSYEKWKSFAELWIVSTWVWLWIALWKKWLKLWIKQLSKMRLDKEIIVKSPEIKDVIWEVNWKLDEILPKQELDFEKLVKDDIIEKWKEEILPDKQDLMQWKVNESVSNQNSLYDDPRYKFLKDERYKELVDELWFIDNNQVVWEWVNALVINNIDDSTKVRKISKIWKDDVVKELKNHNKLFDILKEVKAWNKEFDNIKIPELFKTWNDISFIMEKISGHTPKSDFYLSIYKDAFKNAWINPEDFVWLSDEFINKFLKENNLQKLPEPNDKFVTPNEKRMEWLLQEYWNKEYNSEKFSSVRKVIEEIEKKWNIEITDRNPGNFMFTPNGDIYIIDFWQIELK